MKRKMISVLLCVTCVAALGGCGNKESGGDKAKATVDIFQNKSEFAVQLEEAAEQYMSENPDVKINVETVQGNEYNTSLKAKLLNDDQPEIFGSGLVGLIEDFPDFVEDLSDQPWAEHIRPEFKNFVEIDGKILALPLSIEGYGLVYNKEIFEAAGIDGSKLKTYDEIDKAFAKLEKKIENGDLEDKYPVLEAVEEYAAKETFIPGIHTSNVAFQAELKDAQSAYEAKEIEIPYADELQQLLDLETKYTKVKDDLSLLNSIDYATQIGGGLGIERIAVVQQGNWIAPEIQNVSPEVAAKLVIPVG